MSPCVNKVFHLLTAPSLTHDSFVVVLKLSHNAKRDEHTWGTNIRVYGKPCKDVCFGPLYIHRVSTQKGEICNLGLNETLNQNFLCQ